MKNIKNKKRRKRLENFGFLIMLISIFGFDTVNSNVFPFGANKTSTDSLSRREIESILFPLFDVTRFT